MPISSSTVRKALVTGALVVGASAGAAGIASAATNSSSNSSGSTASSAPSGTYGTPPADPATMTHGPGETLLTGTELQEADAAATAAVPGATIIRAETDSSGAGKYEVHMKKSDGSYVTVELDSGFKVIETASGFGAGPGGHGAPGGGQSYGTGGAPSSNSSSASA